MREIKFRAWDNGKMYYTYEVGVSDGNYDALELIEHFDVLMQYTGLKDKNGSEIYECDYVDYGTSGIQEIIFDMGGFGFKKNNGYMFQIIDGVGEVIGNIYENPELLNNKQI